MYFGLNLLAKLFPSTVREVYLCRTRTNDANQVAIRTLIGEYEEYGDYDDYEEYEKEVSSLDPLEFKLPKNYSEQIEKYKQKTNRKTLHTSKTPHVSCLISCLFSLK